MNNIVKIERNYFQERFPIKLEDNTCLTHIKLKNGGIYQHQISTFSDTIYLIFRNGYEYKYKYIILKLTSKQDDIISEDSLNGIVFEVQNPIMTNDDLGVNFNCNFSDLEFQIQCIEFWGEEDEIIFDNKEGLAFWYRMTDNIPDSVHIKRKTMEMMAIQFKTGRWILILPRMGGFNIDLDKSTSPEKVFSDKFAKNSLPKIKMIKSIGERIC